MTELNESTRHIMVAEDDDDDYLIFSVALQDVQIAVALVRAENGDVLMKLLEESIPEILFLDLEMPCKNGRECLKEIRSNKKFDNLPIIIYTSFRDPRAIEYTFREGANIYAFKPNNIRELTEILRRILTINWKNLLYYPTKDEFVINPLSS